LTSNNKSAGVRVAPMNIFTSVNLVTAETADYYIDINAEYAKVNN
jgi:hypothetical protein